MYNEKLVVCIKTAGKILREFNKNEVRIPFSAEYSIYLKNLNSVRALVHISIDGKSVDGGEGFVIYPGEAVDIERFVKHNNLKNGNRFKFIERNAKVEAHRGIGGEDGLIRVEFQFEQVYQQHLYPTLIKEKEYIPYPVNPWPVYPPYKPRLGGYWKWEPAESGPWYGVSTTTTLNAASNTAVNSNVGTPLNIDNSKSFTSCSVNTMSTTNSGVASSLSGAGVGISASSGILRSNSLSIGKEVAAEVNEAGITVEGSLSKQEFVNVSSFPLEATKHVIVLKLVGETSSGPVKHAINVKSKQKCKTCGRLNKVNVNFCQDCGTSLQIV